MASFGITVVLTPILRDVFRSFKVVDQPDQKRKVHVYPIPRVGGIAIAIAYFVAFQLVRLSDGRPLERELVLVSHILPAGVLVFLTGLIDDFFGLKPWQKFIGQFAAAALACWAGVQISFVGNHPIPEIWSVSLTIGWLVVCTNAFNLVDGLDGLATGVGLFATLTIFIAALIQGNEPLAYATLPLAGCLLGFLCFNFNPATVFLGDCGSLLIGFLLGCFGVIWTDKSVTLLGITAPLMALSVPLLDVMLCVVRRWLRNQPIFSADRGHIHHRLLDRGLSPRQAVLILYGLSSLAAIFSLVQAFVDDLYIAVLVVSVFLGVVWLGVHKLGYAEFMLAGKLLRVGELQRGVSANLNLSAFDKLISSARTPAECWEALLASTQTFGFAGARMQAGSAVYESWNDSIHPPRYWLIQVPLSTRGDYLELAREIGSPVLPMVVAPFVDLAATILAARLEEYRLAESASEASVAMQPGT